MTEGPYKLPVGWRWVRLGDVCLPTERRDPTKYPSIPFIYVDISAVDNAEGRITAPKQMLGKEAPSRARKIIRSGDVIFATTRPYLKNVALVGPELDGQICSTGFCVVRANRNAAESRFLYYLCRSDVVLSQLSSRNIRGASYPAVTDRDVYQALLPLPPLAEQRRIVARIDELMGRIREARRLREEARQDAERLWQSVLSDTFPRPGSDLPQGWRWVRLGNVAVREAQTVRPADEPCAVFVYVGMEHVQPGEWDEPQPVQVSGGEIKGQVIRFTPGMVLYGKLRPYLNKVVVPSFEGIASTEFVPIRPYSDVVLPEYLAGFLRSPWFVRYANSNTTGSRQPRTRMDALWGAAIPLPPLPEQRRIVAHLDAVQEKVKALKGAQTEMDADVQRLERSILDKAFRGEL